MKWTAGRMIERNKMERKIEDWMENVASVLQAGCGLTINTRHKIKDAIAEHCPYGWRPMDQKPRAKGVYRVRLKDHLMADCYLISNYGQGGFWHEVYRVEMPQPEPILRVSSHFVEWLDDGRPADPDPDEEAFRKAWLSLKRMDMDVRTSEKIARLGFLMGRKSVEGEQQ